MTVSGRGTKPARGDIEQLLRDACGISITYAPAKTCTVRSSKAIIAAFHDQRRRPGRSAITRTAPGSEQFG
jgi:hypothetical protein